MNNTLSYKSTGLDFNVDTNVFTDDLFDSAIDYITEEPEKEYTLDDFDIDRYWKVGFFFGWSWQDYENTPDHVIDRLSEKIDEAMEQINNDNMTLPHWRYLEVLLAIGRAFGGKKED